MKEFLNSLIEGLARFGCGLVGLPYPPDCDQDTLP